MSNNASEPNKDPRRGGSIVFIPDNVLNVIEEELPILVSESNVKCGLVIDRTGCILSSSGDFYPHAPQTVGAMSAGIMAALNSMASHPQVPEIAIKFYGSEIDRLYFLMVADRLILCLLHSRSTTAGKIRAMSRSFSSKVAQAMKKRSKESTNHDDLQRSIRFIESKLDDMFKDPR